MSCNDSLNRCESFVHLLSKWVRSRSRCKSSHCLHPSLVPRVHVCLNNNTPLLFNPADLLSRLTAVVMYESRIYFLFTIFVACLVKRTRSAPQVYHSADFSSSHHPYYGYDSQQTGYYASGSHVTVTNNASHSPVNQTSEAFPAPNAITSQTYFAAGPQPQVVPPPLPSMTPFHHTEYPHQQTFHHHTNHMSPPQPPHVHNPYYTPPIPSMAPSTPTHYSQPMQVMSPPITSSPPAHSTPFHQHHYHPQASTIDGSAFSQPFYTSGYNPPPSPQLTYPAPPPFAGYPGFQGHGLGPYVPANDAFNYHMPHSPMSYADVAASQAHYAVPASHSSPQKTTTKKATPTTPRPKTTTTPKPFEFELSIEDFLYLTQLHQMFNKSRDKQSIDISSLTDIKSVKKPGEDKDESRKYLILLSCSLFAD